VKAHLLMALSVIALFLSALVSVFELELWLAGTQWILVAILFAVYALAISAHKNDGKDSCSTSSCGCDCGEDEGEKEDDEQE